MSAQQTADPQAGYCANCRARQHNRCQTASCACRAPSHALRPPRPTATRTPPRLSTPSVAKAEPVWELVKADPPVPAPKKTGPAERARPLLEEILVSGSHDWHRLAVFPNRAAGFVRARLAKHYSATEWEFTSVRLAEVDQSALYVRWIGTTGGTL